MGQWPWLGLYKYENTFCGVTLVSKTHAITAAHCVNGMNINSMEVRFGDIRRIITGATNAQYKRVKRVTMHPSFRFPVDDIAVIEFQWTAWTKWSSCSASCGDAKNAPGVYTRIGHYW